MENYVTVHRQEHNLLAILSINLAIKGENY